jgi:hypothetical protein
MKYVLVQTSYQTDTEMVEELYLSEEPLLFFETRKLSEAKVWDNFDSIADYVEDNKMDDWKVVCINDKDLFEARLKDE